MLSPVFGLFALGWFAWPAEPAAALLFGVKTAASPELPLKLPSELLPESLPELPPELLPEEPLELPPALPPELSPV